MQYIRILTQDTSTRKGMSEEKKEKNKKKMKEKKDMKDDKPKKKKSKGKSADVAAEAPGGKWQGNFFAFTALFVLVGLVIVVVLGAYYACGILWQVGIGALLVHIMLSCCTFWWRNQLPVGWHIKGVFFIYTMGLIGFILFAVHYARFAPDDVATFAEFITPLILSGLFSLISVAGAFLGAGPAQRSKIIGTGSVLTCIMLVAAVWLFSKDVVQEAVFAPDSFILRPNYCMGPNAGELAIPRACSSPKCMFDPPLPDGVTFAEVDFQCVLSGWANETAFAQEEYKPYILCSGFEFRISFRDTIHISSSTECGSSTRKRREKVLAQRREQDENTRNRLLAMCLLTCCLALLLRSSFWLVVREELRLDCYAWCAQFAFLLFSSLVAFFIPSLLFDCLVVSSVVSLPFMTDVASAILEILESRHLTDGRLRLLVKFGIVIGRSVVFSIASVALYDHFYLQSPWHWTLQLYLQHFNALFAATVASLIATVTGWWSPIRARMCVAAFHCLLYMRDGFVFRHVALANVLAPLLSVHPAIVRIYILLCSVALPFIILVAIIAAKTPLRMPVSCYILVATAAVCVAALIAHLHESIVFNASTVSSEEY